jgi:hypothetical protein
MGAFRRDIAWMFREFGGCIVRAGRDLAADIRRPFYDAAWLRRNDRER